MLSKARVNVIFESPCDITSTSAVIVAFLLLPVKVIVCPFSIVCAALAVTFTPALTASTCGVPTIPIPDIVTPSAALIPFVLAIGIVVLLLTAASVVVTTLSMVKAKFFNLKSVLLNFLDAFEPLPVNVKVLSATNVELSLITTVPPVDGCKSV